MKSQVSAVTLTKPCSLVRCGGVLQGPTLAAVGGEGAAFSGRAEVYRAGAGLPEPLNTRALSPFVSYPTADEIPMVTSRRGEDVEETGTTRMDSSKPPGSSSVLFQSADKSVVLLDIPRSLEESQVLPGHVPDRRIYSAPPPAEPFPTPEPKDGLPSSQSPAVQVANLMTGAAVQAAMDELLAQYAGPLHGPRLVRPEELPAMGTLLPSPSDVEFLCGSIQDLRQTFRDTAPEFDLIVLDPPWPNRSALRKTKGYTTAATLKDIRQLLDLIPVASHLKPGGLVAAWITNKPSIMDLMTSPTGIFASWGMELVTEWTWLKITSSGEPIYDIDSTWRKPWEKLLIARKVAGPMPKTPKPKTMIAVPDVHSRKPNLRALFQDVLGDSYRGLEIFSRNLTAGWWGWGDETLRFQDSSYWAA